VLPLLFERDDLDGNVSCRRVELELVQHGPAEHVGQEDIERNGRRFELPRQCQRMSALAGNDALEAVVACQRARMRA
jgi:hypothetical protein